jgi:hypothetical protein
LSDWMLTKMRKKRLISFLKIGHKTIVYDLDKFEAALAHLEVEALS